MSTIKIPTGMEDFFVLSNGVRIPPIGYGTWKTNPCVAMNCVKSAIDLGYRHIDAAWIYGNETEVGQGIRASGIRREDLFVTSKHWTTMRGYEKTIKACEISLRQLKLDYLDLYLIHWPCVKKASARWDEINADTWRGFERLYRDGKLRSIGVSNFLPDHLDSLIRNASIAPMVNQIEFHPGYFQPDTVTYCQDRGILVEAWSPLGNGGMLKNSLLAELGRRYQKSPAQICLRNALQSGVLPLPKSVTPERIAQNAQVFDFSLERADMTRLAELPPLGMSGLYPEEGAGEPS